MWVDARSLHQALGVNRDFSTWIRGRIEEVGATENEDYAVLDGSPNLGSGKYNPKPRRDYLLSLDLGKEVAMLEKNDVGKAIRRYFIDAEKTVPLHSELVLIHPDLLVDSRIITARLENQHKNVLTLIEANTEHFEGFGHLAFETRPLPGGGLAQRYAPLNEDQCYFLLSLSRNNETVVALKAGLVRAFRQAREAATSIQALRNRRKK